MEWGRMIEECQNEWGELSQVIEKHINFMMERYLETGKVSRSIVTRIGFFRMQNNLIYPAHRPAADMLG